MTITTPQKPTYAKVSSISQWITYFHPIEGIFRLPFNNGESIEHLDIDLRYVEHEYELPKKVKNGEDFSNLDKEINLPRVVILTLRGGEYVQDDESRMDSLAEVLAAINPVEIHWINAATDPSEQLTFATHIVHPAIIAAGELWSKNGSLRKLVVQGGFPVPNLTAPTPFSLTPAATPCPSPGPGRTSFGGLTMSHPTSPAASKFGGSLSSGLPALSTIKPKPLDEERLKARTERQRLAEYTLKPRFEYAFGSWTVDELRWRLDGRYTPACKLSIITHLLRAFGTSFPSSSRKTDIDLPSMILFTTVPRGIINELIELPEKLELDKEVKEYLQDVMFISIDKSHCPVSRLWDNQTDEVENRERQGKKIKSEMILLQQNQQLEFDLVGLEELIQINKPTLNLPSSDSGNNSKYTSSPAISDTSILPGETEFSTEDEREAITPELGTSQLIDPSDLVARENNKGERVENPTLSDSMGL